MALNIATFKTRTLTAILFAVVMLTGLFVNNWTFFLLFSVVHFGCWFEYQKLVAKIDPGYEEITPFHRYGVMLAGWCLMLWFSGNMNIGPIRLHEIGLWLGIISFFILPIVELLFSKQIRPKNIAHSFFGILYISLSWALFMNLRSMGNLFLDTGKGSFDYGIIIPAGIVFSIWINDTMAYIVGSLIGKTPLSPISPKKTWEGTIGGAVLSIVVIALLGKFTSYGQVYSVVDWIVIAALSSIMGTMGDLLESKLKRLAGVKDSGSFMPGHGGFLDRFDSLLIAIPFVWVYVKLFIHTA